MIEAHKHYTAPVLTVYGRLEDVTMLWMNPTATDNTCPGPTFVGSQNINSGMLCMSGPPPVSNDGLPADLSLIDPELAEELSGMAPAGDGS
ncbi:MAG: hypothetical protein SGJ24_02245 [Chloroflexota bacterium]|nr:hypothetical protein [Chloroflexota bacterium]